MERTAKTSKPGRSFFGKWELVGVIASMLLLSGVLTIFLAKAQTVGVSVFVMLFIVSLCFVGAYYLVRHLVVQPLSAKTNSALLRVGIHFVGVVLAVLIGGEIAARISALPGGMTVAESRLKFMPVGFALLLIGLIVTEGYDALRRHIRKVELREAEVRHQALRAELSALQARTNPHFLFNSLNTVSGLIGQDPVKAELAITKLVGLMRYTLKSGESTMVRLIDEVQSAEMYFEVESIRFGDRLRTVIEVGDGLDNLAVPPLILQPLVENAVLHGIAPRREGGTVTVRISQNGAELSYAVEDDGPGPGGSTQKGTGTALADMRERLGLLYGGKASLTTGVREGGGFSVRVGIPTNVTPLIAEREGGE